MSSEMPDFYEFIKAGNPIRITKDMSAEEARVSWYNELDKQHTFNTRDKVHMPSVSLLLAPQPYEYS